MSLDAREILKLIGAKGGGRADMAQGSFEGDPEEAFKKIEEYLKEKKENSDENSDH